MGTIELGNVEDSTGFDVSVLPEPSSYDFVENFDTERVEESTIVSGGEIIESTSDGFDANVNTDSSGDGYIHHTRGDLG